ncbi:MAG: hypothetical protein QG577_492 [Thermodesulfobacteriota bacterium]|nr:hypothetical protein [Thermodesulfobacteriota bacterium]
MNIFPNVAKEYQYISPIWRSAEPSLRLRPFLKNARMVSDVLVQITGVNENSGRPHSMVQYHAVW